MARITNRIPYGERAGGAVDARFPAGERAGGARLPGGERAGGGLPIGGRDYPQAESALRLPDLAAVASSPVTVGLVDTGLVVQGGQWHPWFGDHVIVERGDADPLDTDLDGMLDQSDGHGTFVAGLILAEAPTAQVRAMRVLDDGLGDDTAVASAISILAHHHKVKLINLSFGGLLEEDSPPRVIELALRSLPDDVLVVCSAGNFGDSRPHWPAAFSAGPGRYSSGLPNVIAVGAAERITTSELEVRDVVADFSSRGPWIDAYAYGVQLVGPHCWFSESPASLDLRGRPPQDFAGWARWSGTSFAAATVTGAIAARMADGSAAPDAWAAVKSHVGDTKVAGVPLVVGTRADTPVGDA